MVSNDGGATWVKYENDDVPEIKFLGAIGEDSASSFSDYIISYWE